MILVFIFFVVCILDSYVSVLDFYFFVRLFVCLLLIFFLLFSPVFYHLQYAQTWKFTMFLLFIAYEWNNEIQLNWERNIQRTVQQLAKIVEMKLRTRRKEPYQCNAHWINTVQMYACLRTNVHSEIRTVHVLNCVCNICYCCYFLSICIPLSA